MNPKPSAWRVPALVLSLLVACASPLEAQLSAPTGSLEDGYFSKNLYPILQKSNCRACHTEEGVASATHLHFPPESASTDQIEAFGRGLGVLVNKAQPEESLLLKKPTFRVEHTGGKLIPPGSDEEKVLLTWIKYLASAASSAEAARKAAPGGEAQRRTVVAAVSSPPALLRRLTHSQYNNTVRDLLGDQTHPADEFPPEDFVNGFKNQAAVQSIPPLLAESYSAAAENLAQHAYESGFFKGLTACRQATVAALGSNPRSPERRTSVVASVSNRHPGFDLPRTSPRDDAACDGKFIRSFGLKAFRRPLTKAEYGRYTALFEKEATRALDPARGAAIVVEAMLQSPNFLFHIERGRAGPWKQYETANRLSYFLWDTMPDGPLLHLAAAGRLRTKEQVEPVARRMLGDSRAQQALGEFVSEWLRFDRLLNGVRDREHFPEFNFELALAMTEETKRLVAHLVWDDGNFMEFFTADYGFLNSDLAALYGLPAPAEEFGWVKFPSTFDRAGFPGEATFLSLTSKPAGTSPTARGLFVREQLLCEKVPNPPPGTNQNLPLPTEAKPLTTRQRMTMHRTNEPCARCHSLIDPVGFGFERFDAIGKQRVKELVVLAGSYGHHEKPKTVELDIDSSGTIRGIAHSDFSSPKEIGKRLADEPVCQNCIVKQLFRYTFGRPETPADDATLENAERAFRDSQFRFKELMIALVRSDLFLD